MHLVDLLEHNARYKASEIAYYTRSSECSWAELRERAIRLAGGIRKLGVRKGDRVCVLLGEEMPSVESWYACLYAGALRCGVNPRFTAREVAELFDVCQPSLVVVSAALLGTAQDAADRAGLRAPFVVFGGRDSETRPDHADFDELIDDSAPRPPEVEHLPDDLIAVCFSSGSTGKPKGIIWSNDGFLSSLYNCNIALGLRSDDVWLRNLPTFGVGILMTTWNILCGFPCVLSPKFDAAEEMELIERFGVTSLTGSATTLQRLVDHPDLPSHDLSSLRRFMYGQGSTSAALVRRAAARLPCELVQMYGMTEGHGLFTILTGAEHVRALADAPHLLLSAGRPMPNACLEVVIDGAPAGVGEVGELRVRGDSVTRGYFRNDELTAERLIDGWLHTGDLGYTDQDGYLYIVDRKDWLIVSGGFNIYPAEVENVIADCPLVAEACVVGIPDPEWGQAVAAVVSLAQPLADDVARKTINDHCRKELAGFKVPKRLEIWDALPMGPSGKLLKREVAETLADSAVHARPRSAST